uniref:Uncharacterized protein n=1 Tax=Anguilla anguilla TaxID=7936 RepID=A0A0E9SJ50_ANGAN
MLESGPSLIHGKVCGLLFRAVELLGDFVSESFKISVDGGGG